MKMIECTVCKHNVSSQAESCPKCGHPIKGRKTEQLTGADACLVLAGAIAVAFILGWLFSL